MRAPVAAPVVGVVLSLANAASARSVVVPMGGVPVAAASPEEAARRILGDPKDVRVTSARRSLAGDHVRFAQLASDGTPIVDAEISVHMTGAAPRYRVTHVVSSRMAAPVLSGARGKNPGGATAVAIPAGGNVVRAGWRAVRIEPGHEWELWIDGDTGAVTALRDLARTVDGTGYVYQPNPLVATGDLTLVDGGDADTPELDAARVLVTLPNLDGSGVLLGLWADVENKTTRADEASLTYLYTRNDDRFEEVNAYYWVDRVQTHLQALGFTGASAILDFPFHVRANAMTADNSYYLPMQLRIDLGEGGVDDGEDNDVVAHEYGHAIQDDVVPGFGSSAEAGAMGEGFGDLVAASMPLPAGAPVLVERACVAAWDAVSYATGTPPCLRRVDGVEHYPEHVVGQVHDDGEIWSGAMWDMYGATGLGTDLGLQLVVEATFGVAPDASFAGFVAALLAADAALHGGAHQLAIRRAMIWHGLDATISPPDPFVGTVSSMPITVESTHPIGNRWDEVATVTVPGASALRLHFASLDMEADVSCAGGTCDHVYLYDAAGDLYAKLGGSLGAFDAPPVPGDTVRVRWVSDGSVGSEGFVVDRVDWVGGGALPDAGVADAGVADAGVADAAAVDATPGAADAAEGAADAAPGMDVPGAPNEAGPPAADASVGGGEDAGCDCRAGGARGGAGGGGVAGLLALVALAATARRGARAPASPRARSRW